MKLPHVRTDETRQDKLGRMSGRLSRRMKSHQARTWLNAANHVNRVTLRGMMHVMTNAVSIALALLVQTSEAPSVSQVEATSHSKSTPQSKPTPQLVPPPARPSVSAPAEFTPPPGDATPQKPLFAPKSYEARFAKDAPKLDGKLDDAAWATAPWTDDFLDIQGPALPTPRYRTRAKMLWDSQYFYIAAELKDPHVWATLKNHDDIVFRDNDFEVFIDPNGDAREYYELEVNVYGTIFDLYLHRRYKEGGPAEHGWNAEGLKTAIAVQGTVDDPTDVDTGWTLEWAIPWSAFKPPNWEKPSLGEKERAAAIPKDGEVWRVNFSRVQWLHNWEGKTAPKGGLDPNFDHYDQLPKLEKPKYEKTQGKPEDNWVWTPQWQIDMHDPRWWGSVKFVR